MTFNLPPDCPDKEEALRRGRIGPFCMMELIGGPKDGTLIPCNFPPPPLFQIPLKLKEMGIVEAAETDPTIMLHRIGRYTPQVDRQYEFAVIYIKQEMWHRSENKGALLFHGLKGKPTIQYDWDGEE